MFLKKEKKSKLLLNPSLETFRENGVNFTEEQYKMFLMCNSALYDSIHNKKSIFRNFPLFPIINILIEWNALPAEIMCEKRTDAPTENNF